MNELMRASLTAAANSIDIDAGTGHVQVRDEKRLRSHGIDSLVFLAVFGSAERRTIARWLIWETAQALGIHPAYIHEPYRRHGHDSMPHHFTAPAMNLRALSYDIARAAFR